MSAGKFTCDDCRTDVYHSRQLGPRKSPPPTLCWECALKQRDAMLKRLMQLGEIRDTGNGSVYWTKGGAHV